MLPKMYVWHVAQELHKMKKKILLQMHQYWNAHMSIIIFMANNPYAVENSKCLYNL